MKSETYQIILLTFLGFFGSAIIGFIFYQQQIFIPGNTNFQFVAAGLAGAIFFAMLEYKSVKEQIFTMLLILLLQLTLFAGRSINFAYTLMFTFYLAALFSSVKLYHMFIKVNKNIKYYLRSLALVTIYGLLCTAVGILLYLINAKEGFPPLGLIHFIAGKAVLTALGLGIGIDFYFQNKEHLFSLLKIKIA